MLKIWAPMAVIAGSLLLGAAGSASANHCDRDDAARYRSNAGYWVYPADWSRRDYRYDRDDRGYRYDRGGRYDRDDRGYWDDRRARRREELDERRERHAFALERERGREREHARYERRERRDDRGRYRDRD